MSFPTRPVAAFALVALLLVHPAGAELVRMKPRRVFFASSSEEVVATGGKDLFREPLLLKGRPSCVAVHFSGELSGKNQDGDVHVVASFDLAVDDDTFLVAPVFHETPTITLPRLVSIDGYACGLPPGAHEVSVRVRAEGNDEVTVRDRTLEVWTETGKLVAPTVTAGPAGR